MNQRLVAGLLCIAAAQVICFARVAAAADSAAGETTLYSGRLLFEPFTAAPRSPHFSGSYLHHMGDGELRNAGAASFGETFSFGPWDAPLDGKWEIAIQPAVFALFDFDAASNDLINADYLFGIPFSYRRGKVSACLRPFHQSSHLGDEFVLRGSTDRVNLSYEAVDLRLSWDINKPLRVYGGGSYILRRDPGDIEPWFTQAGLELMCDTGGTLFARRVTFVFAADLQNEQETRWRGNLSVRSGIQFEPEKDKTDRWQLLLEYYNGNSPNGQFYDRVIEYVGIGAHYYF